jgi:Lipocalin-like domain
MSRCRLSQSIVPALLLAAVAPVARAQSNPDAAIQNFIGTWRLVAIEGSGRGTAPGDRPSGVITYDRTGHVAVQISYKPKRPAFAHGPGAGTAEEKAAAFDSYAAYYGTFTVDPAAGLVIHHLENSLDPNNVGKDNVRYYELEGNRITLSIADDGKGGRLARKDTTRHLIWERLEPR